MSWTRWFPLRFIVQRAAKSQGFLDPLDLLARLRSLAQPSEVGEPIELLRAGLVFHARGLINSKVIQNNLDWAWPYWVERQYDPRDVSFIPRAFSVSHINLTHRNWTAIGYPDCAELPIVDPRGLLTPRLDGWSLDGWIVTDDGRCLLPSRTRDAEQSQQMDDGLSVRTRSRADGLTLTSEASVRLEDATPVCELVLEARTDASGWLVLALRPQNPEGVSFVRRVRLSEDRRKWAIDNTQSVDDVEFSEPPARHLISNYRDGDVLMHLADGTERTDARCSVDLVTAAACFPLRQNGEKRVTARIALEDARVPALAGDAWGSLRDGCCSLECPDSRYGFLYDAAVTSLILHSPGDVYPGPYTYKRFWFRDAAFIIHALLCVGLRDRAARALSKFPERQTPLGYFLSQEGEWDANGEALWVLRRYEALTGTLLDRRWDGVIHRAARWIERKRLADDSDAPHAGLMPAGFSAEHLGPNDYYYWDDFWSVAGLRAAAVMRRGRDPKAAESYLAAAELFTAAIDRSLASCAARLGRSAMPASPYRRLDAGAIGSLAAGYPLQQFDAEDPRLLDSAEYLLGNCFVDGAFFQDMVHSGLNAYLTLHVAQVLLRAGDRRHEALMDAVAALATSTGHWPEAIHPRTRGGCMGDGHHVWAAAEWVLMIRNCFLREEGDRLVLCAGIPERWLRQREPIRFGPAPTTFGELSLEVVGIADHSVRVSWRGDWHAAAPPIEVRLAGFDPVAPPIESTSVTLASGGPGA